MQEGKITPASIERFVITALLSLAMTAAVVYLGDWAVWHSKLSSGQARGTVRVTRTVVAPLKGGKEEFYPPETVDVPCSQSLLPQGGANPCWWIERHRDIVDR